MWEARAVEGRPDDGPSDAASGSTGFGGAFGPGSASLAGVSAGAGTATGTVPGAVIGEVSDVAETAPDRRGMRGSRTRAAADDRVWIASERW